MSKKERRAQGLEPQNSFLEGIKVVKYFFFRYVFLLFFAKHHFVENRLSLEKCLCFTHVLSTLKMTVLCRCPRGRNKRLSDIFH